MDFDLSQEQQALHDSCRTLLERSAGPERARAMMTSGDCDRALLGSLAEAGFLDIQRESDGGPLAAALVTEWVAESAGWAPVGVRALVAPALVPGPLPLVVAIADLPGALVPFGAQADLLIVLDGDEALVAGPDAFSARPASTRYGYPLARVELASGDRLGPGSAAVARSWWRVALAAEIVGAAAAALDLVVGYLAQREQFGRSLASFQALQHRLAEVHVSLAGARWLTREAAFHGAPAELASAAATCATQLARDAAGELHQMSGAMGLTTDFDLHLSTTRMQALRLTAGGLGRHARDLAHLHRERIGGNHRGQH